MLSKIQELMKKYRSQIVYIIFGGLTTVVNYLVYLPCLHYLESTSIGNPATISNTVAWVFAVIFAYLTNKPFVFESHDWSIKTIVPEFIKFVGTRVVSWLVETGILFLAVDTLGWNGLVWKLITSVLVVVLNYVGSKLLVFRGKKG